MIVCVHFGVLYSWMNWIAPTPGVCVCVAIVFLPVTIRAGLRRSLFKRPWCEAETKSRQKDSLTLWQRSLKTTKRWLSLASVIRCRSADARFWPGKHRKFPTPLPESACQNTIPLAWHLKSAFYSLAPCIQKCQVSCCCCNKPLSCQLAALPREWRTVSAPAVQH